MRYIIPYMCILLPWSCSLSNFCFTISSYSPSPSLIDLVLYNSLFKLKKEFPHVRENMLYFPFSFVYLLSTMPYISVSFSNEWQNPMYSLWLNNNIKCRCMHNFLGFFFSHFCLYVLFGHFICFLLFMTWFLCSYGCLGTHSVHQAGLKLRDAPGAASTDITLFSLFICRHTWNWFHI